MLTLLEAMDWADKFYGKRDWVRSPFGDYHDASLVGIVKNKTSQAVSE